MSLSQARSMHSQSISALQGRARELLGLSVHTLSTTFQELCARLDCHVYEERQYGTGEFAGMRRPTCHDIKQPVLLDYTADHPCTRDGQPGAAKTYTNGKARDGLAKGQKALAALQGLNMWHSITTEPGCEKVSSAVAEWICQEADIAAGNAAKVPSPRRRASKSPVRQRYTARNAAKGE